jgi:hypothetical protein
VRTVVAEASDTTIAAAEPLSISLNGAPDSLSSGYLESATRQNRKLRRAREKNQKKIA